MVANGNGAVSFIKGETYKYSVVFSGANASDITGVKISCNVLGFCHALSQDPTNTARWYYVFTSGETSAFNAYKTTYSLTVTTSISDIETQILANQLFEVKQNRNPSC